MGRRSKLTEKQWETISERMLAGESARALAREFGISESTIRERFSTQHKQIKNVAHQIVATDAALKALPISAQVSARNLADRLRSISENLADAAHYGAMTAHRLSGIANAQLDKIDDVDPLQSVDALRGIAALTDLANESSKIAVNLLRANKETVDDLNKSEKPRAPSGLGHFYGESDIEADAQSGA